MRYGDWHTESFHLHPLAPTLSTGHHIPLSLSRHCPVSECLAAGQVGRWGRVSAKGPHILQPEFLLHGQFPLMQPAKLVDLILVFSADLDFVACLLVLLGELGMSVSRARSSDEAEPQMTILEIQPYHTPLHY